MIVSTILFVLAVLLIDFFYNRANRRRRLINKIPGPPCWPLIGNLLMGLIPAGKFII